MTLGGTAAGTLAATVTNPSGDQMTYNVAVSGMTGDGTVTITLAAGAAHDAVGNPSLASTSTDNSVTYDTTAPTVTIDQAAPQKNPTNALEIVFRRGLQRAGHRFHRQRRDHQRHGGATTAVVSAWPGSSTEYTVTVSGMTGDGTVVANLLAGAVQDAAGNPQCGLHQHRHGQQRDLRGHPPHRDDQSGGHPSRPDRLVARSTSRWSSARR